MKYTAETHKGTFEADDLNALRHQFVDHHANGDPDDSLPQIVRLTLDTGHGEIAFPKETRDQFISMAEEEFEAMQELLKYQRRHERDLRSMFGRI